MKDGHTQKLGCAPKKAGFAEFNQVNRAKIVVVSGVEAGLEYPVDSERLTVGRGPGVDLAFDNQAMSRQHAVFEYSAEGFRVRDLGSTNGIQVNGQPVQVCEIDHGDRVQVGTYEFQFLIEERETEPDTYELPAEI